MRAKEAGEARGSGARLIEGETEGLLQQQLLLLLRRRRPLLLLRWQMLVRGMEAFSRTSGTARCTWAPREACPVLCSCLCKVRLLWAGWYVR